LKKVLLNNFQISVTSKLQTISQYLNKEQKYHLNQVKDQKKKLSAFSINVDEDNKDDNDEFLYENVDSPGLQLSFGQERRLNRDRDVILERDKEIAKITEQMREIAKLFTDLANIVVEQGELIDKIAEEVEEAVVNVGKGADYIQDAAKNATGPEKKYSLTLLICIIICVAFVVIILLAGKFFA